RPPLKPVDATRPLLGCFSAYAALAGVFFLLLYWHMQPSVLPNPGMTVRFAPPGTRLEPLPRKMDAPELAAVQESAPSSEAYGYAERQWTGSYQPWGGRWF